MENLQSWIKEQIKYKEDLNEKYRQLDAQGEPLYSGRILFGCGYIQAMNDILKQLPEEPPNDNSTPS